MFVLVCSICIGMTGCHTVNESRTQQPLVHDWKTQQILQEPTCENLGFGLQQCGTHWWDWKIAVLNSLGHQTQGITCQNCWEQIPDWDDTKVMFTNRLAEENGIVLSGDVVIPEFVLDNGVEKQVIAIGPSLCYENTEITSITMPDSVVAIQDFAFHGCSNLQSVTWSSQLTWIGRAAFQLCPKLTYTPLPDSVKYIQDFSLNHSGGWKTDTVHIPSQIQRFGENPNYGSHLFYDCGTFQAYELKEDNLHYRVEDGVLYSREGVCVSIPSAKEFSNHMFVMPEFMTSFAELAGNRNPFIQTVVLSDAYRLTYANGAYPRYFNNTGNNLSVGLYGYNDVRTYQVLDSNPVYSSIDGVLYNKEKNVLLAVPNDYTGVLDVPEGVVEWREDAMWLEMVDYFDGGILSRITEIRIPSTLCTMSDATIDGLNHVCHKFGTRLSVSSENPCLMIRDGNLVRK